MHFYLIKNSDFYPCSTKKIGKKATVNLCEREKGQKMSQKVQKNSYLPLKSFWYIDVSARTKVS